MIITRAAGRELKHEAAREALTGSSLAERIELLVKEKITRRTEEFGNGNFFTG
ncbi:MAG: hypothetical protein JWR26_2909 [Pedosphaera sp.]|nr:hypothetical protein [Pedosphaera sp.]